MWLGDYHLSLAFLHLREIRIDSFSQDLYCASQKFSLWYNKKLMSGLFPSFGHIAPKTLGIPEVMGVLHMLAR